jgi:hypothetical protein
MIITVRGPSGAGKSHLARVVMTRYPERVPQHSPGRRRPSSYLLRREGERELVVLGHYEIANGGTDTLGRLDEIYAEVRRHDDAGRNVMYEGKCMSDGATSVRALLAEGRDVRILYLSTPVEECVASVRSRGHSIADRSIVRVALRCSREYEKLRAEGARVEEADRQRGLERVLAWLEEGR